MIGVTSFGGYIPRLRLDRMAIYDALGWFAPALIAVAQGERSVCNWDEDSLSMAVEASRDALIGADRSGIDRVMLCSTTLPYADRSNAGILSTALGLAPEVETADITSNLRAGTTGLVLALDALAAGTKQSVLVTATDMRRTRGASFYEMWFGDGAASVLLGTEDVVAEFLGSFSVSYDLPDHYRGADKVVDYTWEERWVRDVGYAKILPEAIEGLLAKLGLGIDAFAQVVYPCFFDREHKGIANRIGASNDQVGDNMHRVCGETGAAHPLVMLVRALETAQPGDLILVAGFGQGSDALAFRVTEAIAQLPARVGISGSLERRCDLPGYSKFAKFRGILDLEMGIRGEIEGQTAMTTLYRNREAILGLVGSRCTVCGTPHYPPAEICVNPDCGAVQQMEPYPFADKAGQVVMYTGDLLAVSIDPPAVYGLVQFEGGGRTLMDFTDCTLDEVEVGTPVRMSFRRRWYDENRGYTGYFWKAVPENRA